MKVMVRVAALTATRRKSLTSDGENRPQLRRGPQAFRGLELTAESHLSRRLTGGLPREPQAFLGQLGGYSSYSSSRSPL